MLQKSIDFRFILLLIGLLGIGGFLNMQTTPALQAGGTPTTANPILFVTQIPIAADFATIGSTFANHRATLSSAGRGGDLWIRYPNGTLKNLTETAGYGTDGFQGADGIGVRDPAVYWDGTKAIFSMVIGSPTAQYQVNTYRWQLYEITGLGLNDTPVITKVPNQPEDFNNISPIYGTDDRIIFTSDRPRNGAEHLYPQLDEYESTPTNTGLWSLDPTDGDLILLNHAPSGDFSPMIDSNGRIVFTQWDHLQRDQQADADALTPNGQAVPYGAFNYSSELENSVPLNDATEIFPEPRAERTDLLQGTNQVGHSFNHFFPWMIEQDGTEGEVLLHLGRQELHGYIPASLNDDPNVIEFYGQYSRTNSNSILNMFHIEEDPTALETYFGVDAPEFQTHSAGHIISLNTAGLNADQVVVNYVTDPDNNNGRYREPLPMSDGALVAVYSSYDGAETGSGFNSDYNFRLYTLANSGGEMVASAPLTNGISKNISYWDPDSMVSYNGVLWELNPVEVKVRTRPAVTPITLESPEQTVFDDKGVNVAEFQQFLVDNNLALAISRDVTSRDDLDRQQPFNLRVSNGGVQTIGASGEIYDVAYLQFFQGMQIRGYNNFRDGRRVIAQPMFNAFNPPSNGPTSSVAIGQDGSMAALVPTQRALTWQLTDDAGNTVVAERYWLTFQAGEIRVCASCHGLSDLDQVGQGHPQNSPEALGTLLDYYLFLETLNEDVYLPTIVND
ncbi:MAG: hypothetical protein AAF490_00005 [Chloroflexota bacterium]